MKNIVLIGMPGSGKSTVGVLLAKALGYSFVDVDLIICKEAGKQLQEILDNEGLDFFLHLEGGGAGQGGAAAGPGAQQAVQWFSAKMPWKTSEKTARSFSLMWT